jgi:hypothetical protein
MCSTPDLVLLAVWLSIIVTGSSAGMGVAAVSYRLLVELIANKRRLTFCLMCMTAFHTLTGLAAIEVILTLARDHVSNVGPILLGWGFVCITFPIALAYVKCSTYQFRMGLQRVYYEGYLPAFLFR